MLHLFNLLGAILNDARVRILVEHFGMAQVTGINS